MTKCKAESEIRSLREIIDVAQAVISTLNLDDALQQILHHARDLVNVPAGSIALYCEDCSIMSLHAAEGLSDKFVKRESWQVEKGGLTQTILDQNRLFVVTDTEQASFFKNPLAIEEGIRSLIAVPLKIQEKIVGILYLNDFVPRSFGEDKLEVLTILASFAALSIENARLHEKTKRLACTDGLTDLYNHRQFKRMLCQELQRTSKIGCSLSLVMFDIDDFKKFNDCYGHPCGDKVLVHTAEQIQEVFRETDLVFRYGGEEFIVILPGSTLKQAVAAAERARKTIAAERIFCSEVETELGITVSVGVAASTGLNQNPDAMLKVVDELLYRAKREGKNRVYYEENDLIAS